MATQSFRGVETLSGCGMPAPETPYTHYQDIRLGSIVSRSVRMAPHSLRGVMTRPSVCGMPEPETAYAHYQDIRVRSGALCSVRMAPRSLRGVMTIPSVCGMPAQETTSEPY